MCNIQYNTYIPPAQQPGKPCQQPCPREKARPPPLRYIAAAPAGGHRPLHLYLYSPPGPALSLPTPPSIPCSASRVPDRPPPPPCAYGGLRGQPVESSPPTLTADWPQFPRRPPPGFEFPGGGVTRLCGFTLSPAHWEQMSISQPGEVSKPGSQISLAS